MKKIFFTFFLICSFKLTAAEFKKISSFQEVNIKEIDQKALVVTDINDTIVSCEEPVFQKETIKALPTDLVAKIKSFTPTQKNYLANLIITQCKNKVIGDSATFMKNLHQKKISHIALTAAFSGLFEGKEMKLFVTSDLKRLGIEFHQNFVTYDYEFTKLLKDPVNLSYPIFYNNIAFTSGNLNNKGSVLKAFLEQANQRPSMVLFFDDSLEHLSTVTAAMVELKIPIRTFHVAAKLSGLTTLKSHDLTIWKNLIASAEKTTHL